jgi:ribosomal protein S18 acetylase RimI-like enzyme
MEVFQARAEHLEDVAKLFDQYRVFYKSAPDGPAARKFIEERLEKGDSTLLVASHDGRIVGFTQLYPSFSSVSMRRVWILNDLFVDEAFRGQGVAQSLIGAAEEFARATGAVRMILATQMSNVAAQSLYESRGYAKDEAFYHYALSL